MSKLTKSNLVNSILKLSTASFISLFVSFITIPLYIKFYHPHQLSDYTIYISLIAIMNVLINFGSSQIISSSENEEIARRNFYSYGIIITGSVILLMLIFPISVLFKIRYDIYLISLVSAWFLSISNNIASLLIIRNQTSKLANPRIIQAMCQLIPFIVIHPASPIISDVISKSILVIMTFSYYKTSLISIRGYAKQVPHIDYMKSTSIASISFMDSLLLYLPVFIYNSIYSPSILGQLGMAQRIISSLTGVISLSVVQPIYSLYTSQRKNLLPLHKKTFLITFFLSSISYIVMFIITGIFIKNKYLNNWTISMELLQIISIGYILWLPATISSIIFYLHNNINLNLKIKVFEFIIKLIIILLFIGVYKQYFIYNSIFTLFVLGFYIFRSFLLIKNSNLIKSSQI